ncbi:MAG: hypothetical protein O7D34_01720 [Ignavibacteria bacterium]|nr:hypothetical protein [Ignavibacteria bacterium]
MKLFLAVEFLGEDAIVFELNVFDLHARCRVEISSLHRAVLLV